MPAFDTSDVPFINRMLTVPHRSGFYTSVDEFNAHADEPYTYLGIDGFASRHFPAWRPYFMRWLLEGYQTYCSDTFCTIPPGCKQLKEKLIGEKNVIAKFVATVLEFTDNDEDRVSQKQLWLSLIHI